MIGHLSGDVPLLYLSLLYYSWLYFPFSSPFLCPIYPIEKPYSSLVAYLDAQWCPLNPIDITGWRSMIKPWTMLNPSSQLQFSWLVYCLIFKCPLISCWNPHGPRECSKHLLVDDYIGLYYPIFFWDNHDPIEESRKKQTVYNLYDSITEWERDCVSAFSHVFFPCVYMYVVSITYIYNHIYIYIYM